MFTYVRKLSDFTQCKIATRWRTNNIGNRERFSTKTEKKNQFHTQIATK